MNNSNDNSDFDRARSKLIGEIAEVSYFFESNFTILLY